jgi:hypothetical protein
MTEQKKIPVAKAVNEELMQATFVVMVPDEVDRHGDVTTEEEVRKACFNFNKFSRQPNLYHTSKTNTFEFVESYIAPVDFELDSILVKKGTWLATVQVNNDNLWQMIKDGEINGLSIGAMANAEEIED